MRWSLCSALFLAVQSVVVVVSAAPSARPDVDVSVKFPDSNPFGRVYNGHSNNLLQIHVSNHAPEPIVVNRIYGQYRDLSKRQKVIRNTTSLRLSQPVQPGGLPSPLINYAFHSENKIGEVNLRVWIDYLDAKNSLHSVLAFDDTVTVEEPPSSWFDLQLLSLYLILGSLFSFVGYQLYKSYFGSSLKKHKRSSVPVAGTAKARSTPATPIKSLADGDKAYEDDWIPEHHLRQRKSGAKGGNTSATSGDESDSPKKRKGKAAGRR